MARAAALRRFGAPAWLAAICVAWGVAAGCMALVRGPVSFVLIRMVLGLAESGAFPGVWYYISCWYAPDRTTLPYSIIETGITVSQVVAAPAAAGLLLLDGKLGLAGFQWIFIVEGALLWCSELLRAAAATYRTLIPTLTNRLSMDCYRNTLDMRLGVAHNIQPRACCVPPCHCASCRPACRAPGLLHRLLAARIHPNGHVPLRAAAGCAARGSWHGLISSSS